MEDAHTAMTSLHDIDPQFSEWSFFAIFDGHAGGEVAKMGSCDLFPTIAADPTFSKAARNLAKQEDMVFNLINTYIYLFFLLSI